MGNIETPFDLTGTYSYDGLGQERTARSMSSPETRSDTIPARQSSDRRSSHHEWSRRRSGRYGGRARVPQIQVLTAVRDRDPTSARCSLGRRSSISKHASHALECNARRATGDLYEPLERPLVHGRFKYPSTSDPTASLPALLREGYTCIKGMVTSCNRGGEWLFWFS